jgi:thiol-disulfide isomerase/thioredoxin
LAAPLLLELENHYKEKINILKIDGEKELKLVETFSIDTIPTFVIFQNLKVVETISGFKKFDLEKVIRTYSK